jgi:hypothetical protein
MEWFTGPALLIGGVATIVVAGLIALGVRYLERRSRLDEEAAGLQRALTEPLAREPALANSSVLPVATLPMAGRARIELTGWVRSRAARDAAVRAIEAHATRLGRRVRVVDHLEILGDEEAARRPA